VLAVRRGTGAPFLAGSYEPLAVEGAAAGRVFAFLRRAAEGLALTAVPRLIAGHLMPGQLPPARWHWAGTRVRLPPALAGVQWTNPLTLETFVGGPDGLDAGDLFGTLPVAVLLTSPPA
jgi:(1->4)-alpha-D-glucan 1-alpha-D-glucosylmutase